MGFDLDFENDAVIGAGDFFMGFAADATAALVVRERKDGIFANG